MAGTHEIQDKDVEDDRVTTSTFRGCDRRGADGTWTLRGSAWVGRMADVISQSLSRCYYCCYYYYNKYDYDYYYYYYYYYYFCDY